MTEQEFREEVRGMRDWQRKWFRSLQGGPRDYDALTECKQRERRVDEELKRPDGPTQGTLFGRERAE